MPPSNFSRHFSPQSQTRQALREANPNLYFISDGLYNSSIEVQMKVGINAAEEIIAAQGS